MKLALLPLFVTGIFLAGCSGGSESKVPGTWTGPQGMTMTFVKEKTWNAEMNGMKVSGTWEMEGDDVAFKTTNFNGQTAAEIKAQMMKMPGAMTNPQIKGAIDSLEKVNYYKVAADGKTMKTDKAKDTGSAPEVTLTKKES
ncbi:hypothetical protein EON81_10325 [bacterium]|nr:MAG: hypothetical protein EON81_10325 [bacterium]